MVLVSVGCLLVLGLRFGFWVRDCWFVCDDWRSSLLLCLVCWGWVTFCFVVCLLSLRLVLLIVLLWYCILLCMFLIRVYCLRSCGWCNMICVCLCCCLLAVWFVNGMIV